MKRRDMEKYLRKFNIAQPDKKLKEKILFYAEKKMKELYSPAERKISLADRIWRNPVFSFGWVCAIAMLVFSNILINESQQIWLIQNAGGSEVLASTKPSEEENFIEEIFPEGNGYKKFLMAYFRMSKEKEGVKQYFMRQQNIMNDLSMERKGGKYGKG